MRLSDCELTKIEEKTTTKDSGETNQYKAVFETPGGAKITISREDVPFDELIVGEKYDIKIASPQTTLTKEV